MIATQLSFPFMQNYTADIPVNLAFTTSYIIITRNNSKLMFIENKMEEALSILGANVKSGDTNITKNQMKKLKDIAWS